MRIDHVFISLSGNTGYTNVTVHLDDNSAKVEFAPVFSDEFKDELRREIERQARVKFGIAATEGLLASPTSTQAVPPRAPQTFDNNDPF